VHIVSAGELGESMSFNLLTSIREPRACRVPPAPGVVRPRFRYVDLGGLPLRILVLDFLTANWAVGVGAHFRGAAVSIQRRLG
jgi:hypothetical protein